MPSSTKFRLQEKGAAMVEVALVLPIFLLVIVGTVQFCILLFGYCSATYACAIAARYIAVHGSGSVSPCASLSVLKSVVTPYLWGPASSASFTSTNSTWPPVPGQTVAIRISFQYPVVIPFTKIQNVAAGTSITATIFQ